MRALLLYELKKIIKDKRILLMIFVMFLFNCGFLYYFIETDTGKGYTVAQLADVYRSIDGMSTSEQMEVLENDLQEIRASLYDIEEEQIVGVFTKRAAVSKALEECESVLNYPNYLDNISVYAEDIGQSHLLQNADNSYAVKSARLTASVYEKLTAIPEMTVLSDGFLLVSDASFTDGLLLLVFLMLALQLTVAEKTDGYQEWIAVTKRGGTATWIAKTVSLSVLYLVCAVIFYLPNIFSFLTVQEEISWNLPVQSMAAYLACPYEMTIGSLFSLFLIIKFIILLTVGMLLYAITSASRSVLQAGILIILAGGGEIFLYIGVRVHSIYGIFKELNVLSLLDANHYFSDFATMNLFGMPVSAVICAVLFGIILLASGCIFSFAFWNRGFSGVLNNTETGLAKKKPARKNDGEEKGYCTNLLRLEIRKLFRVQKGFLLWLVFFAAMIFRPVNTSVSSLTEYYYHRYATALTQLTMAEQGDYIAQEQQRIEERDELEAQYYTSYENGEISYEVLLYLLQHGSVSESQRAAFIEVQEQYQNVTELYAEGMNTAFVNETGWGRLLGEEGRQDNTIDGILVGILLVLIFYDFGNMENTSGMTDLIVSSPAGKAAVRMKKLFVGILIAFMAAPVPLLFRLIKINAVFQLFQGLQFSTAVQSITWLSGTILPCSIIGYLVLQVLNRIVEAIIMAGILILISEASGRSTLSFAAGCCICVILPLMIYFAGNAINPWLCGRRSVEASAITVLLFAAATIVLYIHHCVKEKRKSSYQ